MLERNTGAPALVKKCMVPEHPGISPYTKDLENEDEV